MLSIKSMYLESIEEIIREEIEDQGGDGVNEARFLFNYYYVFNSFFNIFISFYFIF